MTPARNTVFMIVLLLLAMGNPMAAESPHAIKMEEPDEETQYRSNFRLGLMFGNMFALSDDLRDRSEHFARTGLQLSYHFTSTTAFTADFDLLMPDGGTSGRFGVQQAFLPFEISPYAGAQAGYGYFFKQDNDNTQFGDRFMGAFQLNGGIDFFRESQFQVRTQANYDIWIGNQTYQGLGGFIGIVYRFGRPGIRELEL